MVLLLYFTAFQIKDRKSTTFSAAYADFLK
jgi:hypothetical protein